MLNGRHGIRHGPAGMIMPIHKGNVGYFTIYMHFFELFVHQKLVIISLFSNHNADICSILVMFAVN